MKAAWIIARREFGMNLRTPLAWTLLGLFSLLSGWIFFNLLVTYADGIQAMPPEMHGRISFLEEVVLKLYGNIHFLMLFFVPPLTMRLLAEERRQGTIDLLWAAPLSDKDIIVGKFLGAWMTMLLLLLPTLLFPVVLFWAGIPDYAVIGGCYLGLALTSACYVAVGLFASALTENQVVAALTTFVFIMASWLAAWAAQTVGNFWTAEVIHYLSVTGHYEPLVQGILSSSDLLYFASFIFLALLAAVKALQSRNW